MKTVGPTVSFAVRTAKGERRRIRSFMRQVKDLGVGVDDLPRQSVRALDEAEKFLGRYIDLLARETPSAEQLEGVIEALGGIDRVVKNAMAEILKSLGWRPDPEPARKDGDEAAESPKASGEPKNRPAPAPAVAPGSARPSSRGAPGRSDPSSPGALPPRPAGGKLVRFPGPRSRGRRK